MNKHQYDTDESKVFSSVCYMKECNKAATSPAILKINRKLEFVIYVCDSCLPRISEDITSKVGANCELKQ
jgi:hypothetical protein